ncbi:MAG: flagellar biosynthesis regulator FlaF [Paracoccaceae bacterium]
MTFQTASHNAYGAATRALATPRSVEYQVFSQVTGQLSQALRDGRPFGELADALHQNLKLWTVLALDLMQPENALPEDLRAKLVSLAAFTRTHTEKVLRRDADAQVLVDINTAIMRGLRGELGEPL